jgi:hypothetical protein
MLEQNIQREILKKMTPEQKLHLALRLYYSAWELKAAWLKSLHDNWSEQEIDKEVKRIFTNAGS